MSIIFTTPEDVEEAYYEAIGRGDLEALMGTWAEDEEIICIHPTGQRLVGTMAVRESWRIIFANNPRLTVHLKRTVCWKGVLLAVHSVVETLYLGEETTPHGPMLSTNVFQRGANGWRLLSHHTSAAATESPDEGGDGHGSRPRTLH